MTIQVIDLKKIMTSLREIYLISVKLKRFQKISIHDALKILMLNYLEVF